MLLHSVCAMAPLRCAFADANAGQITLGDSQTGRDDYSPFNTDFDDFVERLLKE